MRKTQLSRRTAAAALVASAGLLIVGASASAATFLRDVSVVQRSSAMRSSTGRALPISCPPGKNSLGGSAFVSPALGNLALSSVGASGASTSSGGASETDSESAGWRLHSRAFCVTTTSAPLAQGAAASHVKAVEIVRRQSGDNSQPAKSVTVNCPAGKSAISGGGRIAPPNIDVGLTAMQRVRAGTAWRVAAHEVDATRAAWTLHASVVCANVTTETATNDYAAGYASPSLLSPVSSMPLQSVSPSCTGGGWTVVGGGAFVEGAAPGQPPPSNVVLTSSEPLPAGWLAIARETDPTSQAWRVGGVAICSVLNGGPPA